MRVRRLLRRRLRGPGLLPFPLAECLIRDPGVSRNGAGHASPLGSSVDVLRLEITAVCSRVPIVIAPPCEPELVPQDTASLHYAHASLLLTGTPLGRADRTNVEKHFLCAAGCGLSQGLKAVTGIPACLVWVSIRDEAATADLVGDAQGDSERLR